MLVQQRTYEKRQIEIEKAKEFIRRNHYGQKHQQAEDRRKKLERIELVAVPRAIVLPPMGFPPATRSGDIVVAPRGWPRRSSGRCFPTSICKSSAASAWGLIGPNGCGKSTLLRCLLGEELPDAGVVQLGAGVSVGYFDQHLSGVSDDDDVVDSIRPRHKQFLTQQRRDLLARFGITGDTALQKVGKLSGGERNRVALARLAAADANFLVLDEPTNHLDLWAREALEQALVAFDGTVLFVSHDRYFVNRVADHLIVFEPDRVRVIEGNYEAYQLFLQSKAAADVPALQPADGRGKAADGQKARSQPRDRETSLPTIDNTRNRQGRGDRNGEAAPWRRASRRRGGASPAGKKTPFSVSQALGNRGRNIPTGIADSTAQRRAGRRGHVSRRRASPGAEAGTQRSAVNPQEAVRALGRGQRDELVDVIIVKASTHETADWCSADRPSATHKLHLSIRNAATFRGAAR